MKCKLYILFISIYLFISCTKDSYLITYDSVRTIKVSDDIIIDNGVLVHDEIFNYNTYEQFIKYLVESNRFLIVPQKDFDSTNSTDKVVLSIRHDVDDNINSAIKMAYRESKYGITATYFILHTASYYGKTKEKYFKRNDNLIYYLIYLQNTFHQEIGFHNDLVTLQVVYNIDSRKFLKDELEFWRNNGIYMTGSVAHGSPYCYIYHYLNSYFWEGAEEDPEFYEYNTVFKKNNLIPLEKDIMSNYALDYEGYNLKWDYYFTDGGSVNGKRWNMGMVNWDTIEPGKKVVILLHPQHWD